MPLDLKKIAPPAAAKKGVWLEWNGARFLVASSKSNHFQKAVATHSRKYSAREKNKDPAVYLEITKAAMADVVLLDWEEVECDGAPVEPTTANKIALLGNYDFREWIESEAGSASTFNTQEPEGVAEDAEALKSGAGVVPDMGE